MDTLTTGRTVLPVKATVPETAGAETFTLSVAVRVAVLLGVNTTLIVQLAHLPRVRHRESDSWSSGRIRPGVRTWPEADAGDDQRSSTSVRDRRCLGRAGHVQRRTEGQAQRIQTEGPGQQP